MTATDLASSTDVASVIRSIAIVLGGVSFGMAMWTYPLLRTRLSRMALVGARVLIVVHCLVVNFVALTLIEHYGEGLSWRTPMAIVIFSLKIVSLALFREEILEAQSRHDPPSRRATDTP